MDKKGDGWIELNISESHLSVTCNFYPPHKKGSPIDIEHIQNLLNAEGIIFGVKWELLKEIVFKCNTEKMKLVNIEIAKGKKPEKEIAPHLKLEKKFFENRQSYDNRVLHIDYKKISPYLLVKKKEIIAHIVPGKAGVAGKDVFGIEIPYGKKDIIQFVPGDNTRLVDGKVIAICDGLFVEKGNRFFINEVLELKNGIDYHTGHIKFPGDVIIDGEVKDGFNIYSGGSIYCKKTLDASLVVCKKSLFTSYGILGKGKGLVRVGGEVEARFIENCILKVRGKVAIQDSILDSTLYTLDKLEMGDRGRIIGGMVIAVNGITVNQIGNKFGVNTLIQCGIDFVAEQKLEQIREKYLELQKKKLSVEKTLRVNPSEKEYSIKKRLEESLTLLSDYIDKISKVVKKNKDSKVIVRGKAFPGTTIDICHEMISLDKEMKHVIFYLDKTSNSIAMKNLEGNETIKHK